MSEPDQKRLKLDMSDSDDDEEIWEEISNTGEDNKEETKDIHEPLSIEIDLSTEIKKKPRYSKQDKYLRQCVHQIHVLCLLATSIQCYRSIMNQEVQAKILSLVGVSKKDLQSASKQFHSVFQCNLEQVDLDFSLQRNSVSPLTFVALFVSYLNAIGIPCRFTTAINPIPRTFTKIPTRTLEFWVELQKDDEWYGFDPIRKKEILSNEASYVVSFEQGGGVKDVTRRYSQYWSITQKQRTNQWWDTIVWLYSKSYRAVADDLEDHQLEQYELSEKMPTSLKGFLNHPLYVLEKQLHKNEVIYPHDESLSIGIFKRMPVYPRKLVKQLLSRKAWKQKGRYIPDDVPPFRIVSKPKNDGEDKSLYGEWQTLDWPTPTVENDKIPKNEYGNIEVFHQSMFPVGATHISDASAGTTAKKLGIDFAKVVTGFEFRRGQVIPKYDGILVSTNVASTVMDAHHRLQKEMREKQRKKKQHIILARWRKLIVGMQLKNRLERDYL
jgi:hypothetical protein